LLTAFLLFKISQFLIRASLYILSLKTLRNKRKTE